MRLSKRHTCLTVVCAILMIILVFYSSEDKKDTTGGKSTAEQEQVSEILSADRGEKLGPTSTPRLTDVPNQHLNVLLMMTDDMRPQLGCYKGRDFPLPTKQLFTYSPHLDQLASRSLLLRRAYVQYSLCGPSRASMLTSRRPDTTRIYGNDLYWRDVGGNFTTLPQYFQQHGYQTLGLGKVYHQGHSSNNQDPLSWSEPFYHAPYTDLKFYNNDAAGYKAVTVGQRKSIAPLTDEYSMQHLMKRLEELAPDARNGGSPFFIAMGFCKPHLNFVCPAEHFTQHELETKRKYLPEKSWQMPIVSEYCNMANVTRRRGVKMLTDLGLRHLRQAYAACITYVDDMVGQVVRKLKQLRLTERTIVVFVADHGHHNGENQHWGKTTNHELATHVPMMIHIPGKTDRGKYSRSLVEAVDLYPTIVEAAGLGKVPECPPGSSEVAVCTHGKSLMPLVSDPDATLRQAVYHQIRNGPFMAYAIRTDRLRYVAYAKIQKSEMPDGTDTFVNDWDHRQFWTELYDLEDDPNEMKNQTDNPRYQTIRDRLDKNLRKFFTGEVKVPRPNTS